MSSNSFKIKDALSLERIPQADVASLSLQEGDVINVDGVIKFHNGTELLSLNLSTTEVDAVLRNRFDTSSNSAVTEIIPQFPWSSPVQLSSPTTALPSSSRKLSWSPNGEFLACGTGLSPYLYIYQRSGATFTKIADPAVAPTGVVNGISWSRDGQFLTVAHATSPYITTYQRSGSTFTKLADPTSPIPNTAYSVSWTPNSEFLAVAHASTPYITVYKRSGTTFSKLTNPTSLPGGTATDVAWSPDGFLLAVRHGSATTGPYLGIYQRTTSDTLSRTTDPVIQPNSPLTAPTYGLGWSIDGNFLYMGGDGTLTSPNSKFYIYQRSGTTLTKISDPAVLPTFTTSNITFSPNCKLIATCNNSATSLDKILVYSISGTTITKLTTQPTITSNVNSIEFSPDGQFLAAAVSNSPYVAIFQTSSDIEDNSLLRIVNPKLGNQ